MSLTDIVEIEGLSFICDYDHQPKEAETLTYPGCPESLSINSVIYKDIDVLELMSDHWRGLIHEKLMEQC